MKFPKFMKHLKVGVLPVDGGSKLDEIKISENTSLHVQDGYIIKLLSEILKFSYTIVKNPVIGESQPGGNWTGCIGAVQNEKVDMAICAAAVTEDRSRVVSFSHPYIYTALTFVTNKPQPEPNSYAMIYAFSWQLWFALVISFIVMSHIIYKMFGNKQAYSKILINMFGTLFEQSFEVQPRSFCDRLSIISWIIGVMFITYSYKAVLLASVSLPKFRGIYNMKDLSNAARSPDFQCSAVIGSFAYKALTQSREDSISQCIRRTPRMKNIWNFMHETGNNKAAFFGKNYLANFKRKFFISDDERFPGTVGIIVNKAFCCLELLNDAVLRISENGLMQKYQDDIEFFNVISSNSDDDGNHSSNRILKLSDLYGAFVFLILGLLFSTLILVIEIVFYKFTEN